MRRASLSQYQIYDTPHPEYVTGRINISAFAQLGQFVPWPFQPTNVPINGHVCVRRGRGPFPLAIFVHGNHDPLENSTPGYLYLTELLASYGIIWEERTDRLERLVTDPEENQQ